VRLLDPGGKVEGVFHRAFLCRSGAWVPSWVDPSFFAFLEAAPLPKEALEPVRPREPRVEALKDRVREEELGLWIMDALRKPR